MKDKKASILLLAMVCLAGIALVVAQPASVVITNNDTVLNQTVKYPVKTNITDTEEAARTFNVSINQPVNDTTPPNVTTYAPTGTKVSVKTNITATFSEEMNCSTLNNATIVVFKSSSSTLTGNITYDSETNTAVTFDPLSELEYNETYNVTITTGVQDLAGNNMSSDFCWNFTTHREIKTPFMISGYVSYRNGNPVLNPKVTITNLNTTENFSVKTHEDWNYYQMLNDSTHIRTGDMIRINVTDGTDFNETRQHIVTEEDIKNGGFRFKPDLIISKWSETWIELNKVFNITYTVKNIGDEDADESIVSIYIERSDGILKKNYSIKPLAPDESNTSTVGPFNCPCRDIKVCADGDNVIDEFNETNNCLTNKSKCKLPNLKITVYGWDHDYLLEWDDKTNGKYKIYYRIANEGKVYADASNTTINITTFASNGSVVSSIIKNDPVRPLPPHPSEGHIYYGSSGPFTCLCNHNFTIKVCADGDDEILETKENDNCLTTTSFCPASACKPDLEIVNHSEEWIGEPANRTFKITYTVKNVGNAIANNSTTCVHGREDPVPALESGKSYTSTTGPFNLSGFSTTIEIQADCKNKDVVESNEENNWCNYTFGLPHLRFEYWAGWWESGRNRTFLVEYGVWSFGGAASDNTTVYAYIDGNDSRDKNVTDTLSPIPPYEFRYHNSIGPFEMPEDKEKVTYKLCMDRGDGVETCTGETVFGGGACVAEDGWRFTCGGFGGGVSRTTIITDSCTLTGDMYCSEGVVIRGNDIVIDGNGSGILGEKIGCTGTKDNPVTPDNHYKTLGIRIGWYSAHNININNVTIKNMNIRGFCNGIAIVNADNSRIENCTVHGNGVEDGYTYGITVVNSSYVSIHRCEVYNNTGNLTGMNVAGGHGINFHDDCNYCAVTNSHVFNNYLSGILASPTCKYLYIGNNTIEDNGQCNESGFCAGVNLHWKGGFGLTTNSTVENNTIQNNTGSGIYVTQSYTTIKNNTVKGSKKNDTDLNVNGDGILVDGGKLTFLYNNTCCDNEGVDIVNSESSFATFGDDNTCDTTSNYDDEGTRGCNFYCGGENSVCVGATKNFRCGDIVTESCTFNRSMSCRGCAGDGLIAGADGITIDGAGYALTGNYSGTGIFSNHFGVKIKNLQVEDFDTGMKIENTSENFIENCTVRTNLLTGINFSADNGTVRNSRIYDNVGPGILVGGANNTFENNTVAKSKNNGTLPGYGIYLSPDAGNTNLTANFIGDNEYYDIYNDDGALNYNTSDNNTCDMAYNYWDVSMFKDKKYNCAYPWTMPDLIISDKFEKWVDEDSVRYNVTYTIENIGKPKSRPAERSTTWLKIWDVLRATDPVGTLKPGENYTNRTFSYTPTIPEERDSDRIKVCADGADEVKENNPADIFYYKDKEWYSVEEFFEDKEGNNCRDKDEKGKINEISKSGPDIPEWYEDAACVAADGTEYRCGDPDPDKRIVKKSCVFNGNTECPAGHGLIVGKSGITIDGNGFAIGRDDPASSCAGVTESNPRGGDCGICNSGYDNVKIKNLEILHFCNGIGLDGASDVVVGNTIENCEIHDNGNSAGKSHGIHMVNVKDTTITNKNDIHHNRGTGPSCDGGGNGIFLYAGTIPNANNMIVDNDLHDNDRAGFWTKMGMQDCTIKDNRIWGNSRGSGLGTMTGGLVLQCKKSDNNTIENNEVKGNYGRCGIFVGGNCNNLTKNNVHDNKGDGIFMGRNDGSWNNHLKNNPRVCDNGGMDIRTCGDGDEEDEENYENDGAGNFCDRTEDYADDNAAEGCKCWQPCSNVSKPDLKVTEKFETWIVEGENYTVTYTVQNVGKADAPHSTTLIQIVNGDPEYDYSVPSLPPNESYTNEVGPFTTSGESDTITVHADTDPEPAKWVEEDGLGSRDNNCMTNTWAALPDLTVTKIVPPGEISLFKSNTVTAKIENIGNVKTGDAFIVALFVDGSVFPEDTVEVSYLAADGSIPVPLSWTPGIAKDYKLRVFVDCYDKVDEGSNEGNNNLTKEITEETVDYDPLTGLGGGRPPAGEENISGYEPCPGEGTGEFGKDTGTKGQINESSVSGEEKWKKGNPFYGMGGEIIENVKVVAPVFLIIMIVLFVALFYSGYFGEKRAHRRNKKRT